MTVVNGGTVKSKYLGDSSIQAKHEGKLEKLLSPHSHLHPPYHLCTNFQAFAAHQLINQCVKQ